MATILIVDDSPSFLAEAERLCHREGFSTVTAGTWSELNMLLTNMTPDLVLLDVELPSIPGHRLGTFIRARHKIPIVLVSAYDEDRLRRMHAASDADAWISKPLTRDKLIAAVTRFLPSPAVERTTEEAAPNVPPRVLLIEDDAVIGDRIESVLKSTCDVTLVLDGEAAISRLWNDDETFDCILLDLMLPRLSGFDVVRHLMMHRPELLKATVIMSGAGDASLQFIDATAVAGVLQKPFDVPILPELVANVAKR